MLKSIGKSISRYCRNRHEAEEIARAVATLIVFLGAVVAAAGVIIAIILLTSAK